MFDIKNKCASVAMLSLGAGFALLHTNLNLAIEFLVFSSMLLAVDLFLSIRENQNLTQVACKWSFEFAVLCYGTAANTAPSNEIFSAILFAFGNVSLFTSLVLEIHSKMVKDDSNWC